MTENDQDKKTANEEETEKEEFHSTGGDSLPPLDFSSLFLPFYTQALFKLGAAEDPITNKIDEDIPLAKRLIDLLDLLKDKTKGNLSSDEDQLLSGGLHQLKMMYMEKAKIIKI